ncbi:SDR family NAD(P)-dependent oxidoreductase [Salipiger abyssi]|uniref:SDR family NAD(P)-dependent oxidoreductase n=1 Tax=Salipiger abyssi TaxID=1250539 RepID=UPI001F2AB245|nr:SDR family oxidoreductase [Salipiger abyssi]
MPEKIQTAVITGGARGFGAHVVRALHRAGYRVIITDIAPGAEAAALASELDLAGETAMTATLDVSKPEDFQAVLEKCVSRWGSVEILVNNAARTEAQALMEIDPATFNEIVATNAGGTFAGCQIFGRHFKERGYGRLINMASLAGQNGGTATGAHYAASKGAILTLTKVFARDLAPFGITCNAIAPGPMDTPMVREVVGDKLGAMIETIPVKRLGDPDFVAQMVVMLASPEAAFVNGACWDVNGGLYVR